MNRKVILYILICGFGVMAFTSFRSTFLVQEPWTAPSWTDTLKNPYPLRWGANTVLPSVMQEGAKLYNTYCVSCHGNKGMGDGAPGITFTIKPASFHDKSVTDQTDGALFWKMSEGRGQMAAYGQVLSVDQRWRLVAYIRQLSVQTSAVTISKNLFPVSDYIIDPKIPKTAGQYFPLPGKVLNVVKSESQLFMVDTVASGLIRPWSMCFLPDNSVLIAERDGLLIVKNGKVQAKPVGGNIPKELRDIKLHPQYATNGWIYITHHIDPVNRVGGYTELIRARLKDNNLVDQQILYKAGPLNQGAFWYGSRIAFDKDGYLFLTVGISGARANAQDLSVPMGKTMRLKDDGSIPSDNPFVHTPGALPEIYTYGHRMHEGLIYDAKTDKLWSTEFGEMGGDELNIIKRGANYGWPVVAFGLEYTGKPLKEAKDSIRADVQTPVGHWTIAPGDLDIVNGPDRYPGWDGNIFIGAMSKTMTLLLRAVVKNDVLVHDETMLENIGRVREVKFGPDKFLYLATEDTGLLVRLVPVSKKNNVSTKSNTSTKSNVSAKSNISTKK